MRIGIDFDNTLIDYADLFSRLARERGLVNDTVPTDKMAVRDHIRQHHADEDWQRIQVAVYGERIHLGRFMPGAREFIAHGREHGHELFVVSHKTRFARIAPDGPDLRQAALSWMQENSFFAPVTSGGFGFAESDVFFAPTRSDKVARINALDLDAFIDDLPEILQHPHLNPSVRRVLFTQTEQCIADAVCGDWSLLFRHFWKIAD
ncbi:hypothetical protein [Desulfovibrio inopinatus]|uniref:hypothetical protein n=1 Tax=Desulfovibrio inopinatus TaxID=102109 RepID=UPI0004034446|nr:hypothetical protein [Desulfovibrio inopinatus]